MGKFLLFFGILLVNFTGAAAELSRNYLLSLAQTTLAGGDIHPADFTPYYGGDLGNDVQRAARVFAVGDNNFLVLSRNTWNERRRSHFMLQYFDCATQTYYHLGSAPTPQQLYAKLDSANIYSNTIFAAAHSLFSYQYDFVCAQGPLAQGIQPTNSLVWGMTRMELPERWRRRMRCDSYRLGTRISHEYCTARLTPALMVFPESTAAPQGDVHLHFNKNCGLYSINYVQYFSTPVALEARYTYIQEEFAETYSPWSDYFQENLEAASGQNNNFRLGSVLVMNKFYTLGGLSVNYYAPCGLGYNRHKNHINEYPVSYARNDVLRKFNHNIKSFNNFYQSPSDYVFLLVK